MQPTNYLYGEYIVYMCVLSVEIFGFNFVIIISLLVVDSFSLESECKS